MADYGYGGIPGQVSHGLNLGMMYNRLAAQEKQQKAQTGMKLLSENIQLMKSKNKALKQMGKEGYIQGLQTLKDSGELNIDQKTLDKYKDMPLDDTFTDTVDQLSDLHKQFDKGVITPDQFRISGLKTLASLDDEKVQGMAYENIKSSITRKQALDAGVTLSGVANPPPEGIVNTGAVESAMQPTMTGQDFTPSLMGEGQAPPLGLMASFINRNPQPNPMQGQLIPEVTPGSIPMSMQPGREPMKPTPQEFAQLNAEPSTRYATEALVKNIITPKEPKGPTADLVNVTINGQDVSVPASVAADLEKSKADLLPVVYNGKTYMVNAATAMQIQKDAQPKEKEITLTEAQKEYGARILGGTVETLQGRTQVLDAIKKNPAAFDKFLADRKANIVMNTPISPAQLMQETNVLSDQIRKDPYVRDYRDINTKFKVMKTAMDESKTTNNFMAVDQSLITLFNKMTDPQSVVRESEYARTSHDLSVMNRFRGLLSKGWSGGAGITQEDRNALFKMAGNFQKVYQENYNQAIDSYTKRAEHFKISPDMIGIPKKGEKIVTRTGTFNGKKVVEYSDGSVNYAE